MSRPSHRGSTGSHRASDTYGGSVALSIGAARLRLVARSSPAAGRLASPGVGEKSAPRGRERLERLPARGDAELAEQALYVRSNRVLGDVEARRDLVRRKMLVQQQQDLDLARAEASRDRIGDAAVRGAPIANLIEQSPGDSAGQRGLARRSAVQEVDDPFGGLRLQEISRRAGTDRREQV